jgi:aminoglycoside 6'-N-acetyltransferase I
MQLHIRLTQPADVPEIAAMCALLWPDGPIEEHRNEVRYKILSGISGTLPVAILVSENASGSLTGFAEVGLRSHADGCDTGRPVAYIEG